MTNRNDILDDPAMMEPRTIKHFEDNFKRQKNVFITWPEETRKKENNVKYDRLGKLLSVGDRCVFYTTTDYWVTLKDKVNFHKLYQYEGEIIKFTKNYVVLKVSQCEDEKVVGKMRRCQTKNIFKM